MATNFGELQMPDAVTVLVSAELLAELEDWSPPVQVQILRTPGVGSGYEMIARTHTCGDAPNPVVAEVWHPAEDCAAPAGQCTLHSGASDG